MLYQTGTTIYNTIASFDQGNDPVPSPTFDVIIFKEQDVYTAITETVVQIDAVREIYSIYFTPIVSGQYQLYVKNLTTDVIWFSEVYDVVDEVPGTVDPQVTIYTGF